MSDYTKTVNFAAKDALTTGNPAKVASGTEVDTEFNNIATAVSTKLDSSKRGANNGVASLDSGGLVPSSQIPATAISTASTDITIQKSTPKIVLIDNSASAGNKVWWIYAVAGTLFIDVASDDQSTHSNAFSVQRSGMTVTNIGMNATNINISGTLKVNGTTVTVP